MSRESRILYHYTSELNLGPIVKSQMIDLTGSNVNHIPVVWMTRTPHLRILGLVSVGVCRQNWTRPDIGSLSSGNRILRSGHNGVKNMMCRKN